MGEMIKNILFDLDGTLTDPGQGITGCIHYALEKLERISPPADELKWCVGPPLHTSFATLLESEDDGQIQKAIAFYRERFSRTGIF